MVLKEAELRPPSDGVPGNALAELTLLIKENWRGPGKDPLARRFVAVYKVLLDEDDAIAIRGAQILCYCRTQDLQQAGYSTWPALVRERAPWKATRTSEYVRLERSRLDVIKQALRDREIDRTAATTAVKELGDDASPEEQHRWIREKANKKLARWEMHRLAGDDKRCVLEARKLGEVLVGGGPPPVVDAFLVDCHERKLSGEQIVGIGREAPPVPPRLTETLPPEPQCDPAEGLLGPLIRPTNLREALVQLDALKVIVARRRVLLGLGAEAMRYRALWTTFPDCASLEDLCVLHLGISLRTLQRHAHDGLRHAWHPEVRKEVEAGRLSFDHATLAMERGGTNELSLQSWLDLVRQMGTTELHHAAKEHDGDLRRLYGPALALARSVKEILRRDPDGTSTRATEIEGTADRVAAHLRRVGAQGPIEVALRDRDDRKSAPAKPGYLYCAPNLLAAARYVLAVVVLPPLYGVRRTVGRDRYTCQNPRCRRRTLRAHPHHMHQRQHGGTDHPANIVSLCPGCHLRGVHGGNMNVVRIDDFLVWTWRTGGVVLMYSPVHELVSERACRKRGEGDRAVAA